MKASYLEARKNPARSKSTVTLALWDDVIADLEQIAPHFGCSNAVSLIRSYIGVGLRQSLIDLRNAESGDPQYAELAAQLRRNAQDVEETRMMAGPVAQKLRIEDFPIDMITRIAKEATRKAARDARRAGRTVAGLKDGQIVEYGPLFDVVTVEVRPNYRLHLEFENGEMRIFDMTPYMAKKPYGQLQDNFMQAQVANGTVCCPGNIDIALETLYDCSVPVGI